ncbi:MAG: putative ABC transport system permease protein [Candidatus Nanohaloarchaea archaeon]|jgi:putative ABC transport system permease protein
MILDLFELSGKNLLRRGKRSWLTIIGIVIGITAIVALFSLSQGLEDSITQEFEDLGANTIYILPGSGVQGLFQGGIEGSAEIGESDLETVRRSQGVGEAGPMIYAQSVGEFQGEQQRVPLIGIPTDSSQEMIMESNAMEVEEGRNLRSNDRLSALAGSNLNSGNIFDQEVGLRSQITVRDNDIRVIGIMASSGDPEYDRSLVMPIDSVRDVLGDEDRTDYILARPQSGQNPSEVADEIERNLRQERNVREGEEDFTVSTADDLLESFLSILGLVQYVVIGIVSIALFVGGLGIMNTMYMSVSERTKEIGIMKSLGATRKQILSIYLIESGALGLIGGVIGVAVGLGISEVAFYFVRQYANMPLYPNRSLGLIGGALSVSFVLGVVSGFLPARKAAKLEPVEAIRKG